VSITGESETAESSAALEPDALEPEAPESEALESESESESDGCDGDAPRRSPWFRRAVAVAVLFALAGGVLQVLALRARQHPASANRALVDTEATSVVIGDVSNGLGKIFSYAPDSTATTEQAAAGVLAGDAANEYRALFAQVKQHAAAERLTVTTHVVRAGVVRLSGRTAQLLVFLDQVILRKDKPKGMSAAAQLSVTARLDGGHWRIVEIHAR
jgi:Mce-associated membrane protein